MSKKSTIEPSAKRNQHRPLRHHFRSPRAYRRFLDRVIRDVYEGRRHPSELQQAAAAAKSGCEMFMLEHQMKAMNLEVESGDHPLGAEGGFDPKGGKLFIVRKVSRKTGVTARGPVDETTTSIESGEEGDEIDPEIAALL